MPEHKEPEAPEPTEALQEAEEEPSPERDDSAMVQAEDIPDDVDMADSPEAEISLREG